VFVVAGPSGAGKDTLIARALEELPGMHYSVSATTRPRRKGEIDGRDYYFISEEEFDDRLKEGQFLEWEEVFGRKYGTLKSEITGALADGKDVLLELDVKGALQARSKLSDSVLIFIMPPSVEELRSRLEKRDQNEDEDITTRMKVAPREIEVGKREFDRIIVNRDAEDAARSLIELLRSGEGRDERGE